MFLRNRDLPASRALLYRFGINLGDVIVDGGDIFGDGINVAARLESIAEPGGICISAAVRDQVGERLDAIFEDLGELHVKAANLALEKPVVAPANPVAPQTKAPDKPPRELPLGNFGGIPQRDQQSPTLSIASDDDGAGWIDAEFGLQYRLRMPDAKIVGTVVGEGRLTVTPQELPLLYLDVRNVGVKAQNVQLDGGPNLQPIQRIRVIVNILDISAGQLDDLVSGLQTCCGSG